MFLNKKIAVDVVCGGQSEEHEVSVLSALSVINGLIVEERYLVHVIYISKEGGWFRSIIPVTEKIEKSNVFDLVLNGETVFPSINPSFKNYFTLSGKTLSLPDIFFPVLHGTHGEDGSIQGLFEMMNVPYVGCGVLGGACGMDKETMRSLSESAGVPLLPWKCVLWNDWETNPFKIVEEIESELNYPQFVKPANLGSSIGISRVKNGDELKKAIEEAFKYSNKIIVEEGKDVREIECGILGNYEVSISCMGEIVPGAEFYDFQDKYYSARSQLKIPASLSQEQEVLLNEYAKKVFRVINAKGLARVDFFICKKTGSIFFNEINTFPGFTKISMYPKLWEQSGISFSELLFQLIRLGFEEHS